MRAPAPAPPTASGITHTPAARSDRPNPTREQNGKPEPGGNGVDPCRTSPREREIRRSGERPLDPDREGGREPRAPPPPPPPPPARRGGGTEGSSCRCARAGGRAGGRLIRASLSPAPSPRAYASFFRLLLLPPSSPCCCCCWRPPARLLRLLWCCWVGAGCASCLLASLGPGAGPSRRWRARRCWVREERARVAIDPGGWGRLPRSRVAFA